MITQLLIKNFVLIESSEILWENQLNILTGETGAGKSIILNALKLILGERADVKAIKNKEKKCVVEAQFDVSKLELKSLFLDYDVDYEENTIIRREILPSGKSRAFINDSVVTLDTLKKITSYLIDIHSQFETTELLDEKFQIELLDTYSGNQQLIAEYSECYKEYKKTQKSLKKYQEQYEEAQKEFEYNSFLLEELNEIDFNTINLEELEEKIKQFEASEQITSEISYSFQILENEEYGVNQFLYSISQKLDKIAPFSKEIKNISERINSSLIELQDIQSELENISDDFILDSEEQEKLKNTYNQTVSLTQKHRVNSVGELQEIKDELIKKTSGVEFARKEIEKSKKEITKIELKLKTISESLHKNRTKNIPDLTKNILDSISLLGMEKAMLEINLLAQDNFGKFGKESIEINFSANEGVAKKTLSKAISGGERSRVMLVLKSIIAKNKNLPTMIFDEIDTGVSGKVANEMGKMVLEMSNSMQVIAITHLPQMASKGNSHYKVYKHKEENQTISEIKKLTKQERINEIAFLLSGDNLTDSAINQAQELLSS
ncbi:MAG: DNA repair protein RecN [Flavobacteriales bacterium]|nr:DNA repair protein RecN [Flavobacteriales bacterium]